MPLPTANNPKIKYVKKAQQWVKTFFTFDRLGKPTQHQEWSDTKPKEQS